MSLPGKLSTILSHNGGIITTAQANAVGVSNERLRLFVKSGELERVAHGVYVSVDAFIDRMYIFQLQRPKIIYSHETALYLHGLTDRDPLHYSVTVPTGYNTVRLRKDGLIVFMVKPILHGLGSEQLETVFGHKIIAYGLERTICDSIRSRNQMDPTIVTDAVKRYTRRNDKNLNVLMEIAEAFRVTKLLRSYLEVLL